MRIVPQIVPPFVSYLLYQWDINVRMATIIGFAGGGGIGLTLTTFFGSLQVSQGRHGSGHDRDRRGADGLCQRQVAAESHLTLPRLAATGWSDSRQHHRMRPCVAMLR